MGALISTLANAYSDWQNTPHASGQALLPPPATAHSPRVGQSHAEPSAAETARKAEQTKKLKAWCNSARGRLERQGFSTEVTQHVADAMPTAGGTDAGGPQRLVVFVNEGTPEDIKASIRNKGHDVTTNFVMPC
jgi:hypothetical protein